MQPPVQASVVMEGKSAWADEVVEKSGCGAALSILLRMEGDEDGCGDESSLDARLPHGGDEQHVRRAMKRISRSG